MTACASVGLDDQAAFPADAPRASIARDSVVLTGATLLASASNYVVNVALARWMDPAAFGDANLIVTLMLALTAVAVALQLTTARVVSTTSSAEAHGRRRRLLRTAWGCGTFTAMLVAVASPQLRDLTSSESALPFVILAAGLPFYLAQAVERGVLQGRTRFGRLAATFIAEAAVRTAVTVGLVATGAGVVGASIGLSASLVASWLAARVGVAASGPTTTDPGSATGSAVGGASLVARATGILLVGQIIINNGDVVIAKALFDADASGRYAVVALVGRAVFFCSWSVVTAAFPHAARGDVQVARHAVRAVAVMSAVLTTGVAVVAPLTAAAVFGPAHGASVGLFGPYALATSLFAVANASATLDVAGGRSRAAHIVSAGALVQTLLLLTAAHDLQRMIHLQVLAMALLCAAVFATVRHGTVRASQRVPASLGIAR